MFSLTEGKINSTIEFACSTISKMYPAFKTPTINYVKVTNAKSYWANIGRDRNKPSGYGMHISRTFELIPDDEKAELRFKSCMIHEIIHTIPGCNNHGKKFKKICNIINKKFPEYKLQTKTSSEDFGVKREDKKPRYIVKCESCGKEYFYFRKPKYNIENYYCSCGKYKLKISNLTY